MIRKIFVNLRPLLLGGCRLGHPPVRFPIRFIQLLNFGTFMSRRVLYTVSMLYLWLPTAIFLVGWAYWWVALLPVLLGLWACIWPFRHVGGRVEFASLWREVLIAALVMLWVVSAGIGGYMWQDPPDHIFRNAVFKDLVYNPWPVITGGQMLDYYFGFWLPSAVVAKLSHSLELGYLCQALYAAGGIWLGLRMMYEYAGRVTFRTLWVLFLFGGFDAMGVAIYSNFFPDMRFEFWRNMWGYSPAGFTSPNIALMGFVFHSYIPSFLATMMILTRPAKGYAPAVLALMSISSPIAAFSMLPITVWMLIQEMSECSGIAAKLRILFSPINVSSVIIIIPVAAYLSINNAGGHVGWYPAGEGPEVLQRIKMIVHILIIIILQMVVWLPVLWSQIKRMPQFWLLFVPSCVAFFIQVGYSADFGSRMQLAVQTFLTLQVAVFVGSWSLRPVRVRRAFAVVSLLCFVSTGWEIGRRVHHGLTVPRNEWRVMQLPNVFVENRCTANFTADASRWHLGPNDVSSPRLDDFFRRHPECRLYSRDYYWEPLEEDNKKMLNIYE